MTRALILTTLLFALFAFFAACGYPRHKDPEVHADFATVRDAAIAARVDAMDTSDGAAGRVYSVLDTHSMEPLLYGGDYIVVRSKPFADVALGEVITYIADWQKMGPPVVHRALVHDSYGYLVGGDNVDAEHTENRYRVTAANYIGTVTAIYRVEKPVGTNL